MMLKQRSHTQWCDTESTTYRNEEEADRTTMNNKPNDCLVQVSFYFLHMTTISHHLRPCCHVTIHHSNHHHHLNSSRGSRHHHYIVTTSHNDCINSPDASTIISTTASTTTIALTCPKPPWHVPSHLDMSQATLTCLITTEMVAEAAAAAAAAAGALDEPLVCFFPSFFPSYFTNLNNFYLQIDFMCYQHSTA